MLDPGLSGGSEHEEAEDAAHPVGGQKSKRKTVRVRSKYLSLPLSATATKSGRRIAAYV